MKTIILGGEKIEISYEDLLKVLSSDIRAISKKFTGRYYYNNEEDILQEARIHVWNAYNKYDITKGADFKTFMYIKLKSKLLNLNKSKYKKVYTNEVHFIEALCEEQIEEDNSTGLIDELKEILDYDECLLLDCMANGIKLSDFCRYHNLPYDKTKRKRKKIKEKVKEYVKNRK